MDAKLKRTTIRIPQDLYDRIVAKAGNDMTFNTLVTLKLLEAFPPPPIESPFVWLQTVVSLLAETNQSAEVENLIEFTESLKDLEEEEADRQSLGVLTEAFRLLTEKREDAGRSSPR